MKSVSRASLAPLFYLILMIAQCRKIEQNHRNDDENAHDDEDSLEDFFVFWIEKHGGPFNIVLCGL